VALGVEATALAVEAAPTTAAFAVPAVEDTGTPTTAAPALGTGGGAAPSRHPIRANESATAA